MRRPCADREEKRVTRGDDEHDEEADQEQLDLTNPNQRGSQTRPATQHEFATTGRLCRPAPKSGQESEGMILRPIRSIYSADPVHVAVS